MSDFPTEPRRVVTGFADGRATIVSDGVPPVLFDSPAFNTVELWRTAIPASFGEAETADGPLLLAPANDGMLARFVYFPPPSERSDEDFGAALAAMGGGDAHDEDAETAAMHATDSLDLIYMVSGELYAVLEDTETLLRPGDTLIQRGTAHAWDNRGEETAVILAVQFGARGESRPQHG